MAKFSYTLVPAGTVSFAWEIPQDKIIVFSGKAPQVKALLFLKGTKEMIGALIEGSIPGSKKHFKAVVLGFYLSDIREKEGRQKILKMALAFLRK